MTNRICCQRVFEKFRVGRGVNHDWMGSNIITMVSKFLTKLYVFLSVIARTIDEITDRSTDVQKNQEELQLIFDARRFDDESREICPAIHLCPGHPLSVYKLRTPRSSLQEIVPG